MALGVNFYFWRSLRGCGEISAERWSEYVARAGPAGKIPASHWRAVEAVLSCRTSRLGGHAHRCADCGGEHYAYHSCNHRSCPRCGGYEQKLLGPAAAGPPAACALLLCPPSPCPKNCEPFSCFTVILAYGHTPDPVFRRPAGKQDQAATELAASF